MIRHSDDQIVLHKLPISHRLLPLQRNFDVHPAVEVVNVGVSGRVTVIWSDAFNCFVELLLTPADTANSVCHRNRE